MVAMLMLPVHMDGLTIGGNAVPRYQNSELCIDRFFTVSLSCHAHALAAYRQLIELSCAPLIV